MVYYNKYSMYPCHYTVFVVEKQMKLSKGGPLMKILVVDDEKTIVKGIKFNLEN